MCIKYKEKTGKALIEEAKGLGVFIENELYDKNRKFREGAAQLRVRNAKMAKNAYWMAIIALIAVIASALSALAAWYAVVYK